MEQVSYNHDHPLYNLEIFINIPFQKAWSTVNGLYNGFNPVLNMQIYVLLREAAKKIFFLVD